MYSYDQLMNNRYVTWLRQGQFLAAVIIYSTLLLMPSPQLGSYGFSDFALHAAGNAILMLSTWLASGGRYKALGPLFFVLPFSVLTELAQGLTDNRTPEMIDIIANMTGVLIGYFACIVVAFCLPKLFKA